MNFEISNFKAILFRLMPSMVLSFALMTFVFYLIPVLYLGRGVLVMVMILSFCAILVERTLFFKWSSLGVLQPRALVLGVGESAKAYGNHLEHRLAGLGSSYACRGAAAHRL